MIENQTLGWKLDIDSVGDLSKMIISLHSDAICVSYPQFVKTRYDRFLNEIPMLQLAQMLIILRENREWFRLLRKHSRNKHACDMYCDILKICLLKVNQHQIHYLKPLVIINQFRYFLNQKQISQLDKSGRINKIFEMNFATIWNIFGQNHDIKVVPRDTESKPVRFKPTAQTRIKRCRRQYQKSTDNYRRIKEIMQLSITQCLTPSEIVLLNNLYGKCFERMEKLDMKVNPEMVFKVEWQRQHEKSASSEYYECDETASQKSIRYHESQQNTYTVNQLRQILYKIQLSSTIKTNAHEKQYVLERYGDSSLQKVQFQELLRSGRMLSYQANHSKKELGQVKQYTQYLIAIWLFEQNSGLKNDMKQEGISAMGQSSCLEIVTYAESEKKEEETEYEDLGRFTSLLQQFKKEKLEKESEIFYDGENSDILNSKQSELKDSQPVLQKKSDQISKVEAKLDKIQQTGQAFSQAFRVLSVVSSDHSSQVSFLREFVEEKAERNQEVKKEARSKRSNFKQLDSSIFNLQSNRSFEQSSEETYCQSYPERMN